ncbi:CU044_5270 family protein [Streptomyces sp. NPDC086787]|uniref:CU044_5270 family protein n=1 Tax=Streptomyces sp. NPDC086787 TaxID=3365759 RepID=UPI0038206A8A
MADELELLRTANPVPAEGGRYADGPLDHHAERRLNRLLHDEHPHTRTARRRPVRLIWGLAATAVVAALSLTALLGGPGSTPAIAAPRPLAVHARSVPVPLAEVAELARAAATDGEPKLRKGTHTQSWSLGMSDKAPPVTLPHETVVRWNADDSHTELVVATDPRHPGRPVLSDEGDEPHLVEDGHVISRTTYPPSWSDAPPQAPPPHDAKGLLAYLKETAHPLARTAPDGPPSTPTLIDAVITTLDTWTLGARETAALLQVLAERKDLRPVGQVTDRLGRTGQAYVCTGEYTRQMLILDPTSGTPLGVEYTFTKPDPQFGVKAGDVMSYGVWMR